MGYNARNDEIRDNVTRMRQEWEDDGLCNRCLAKQVGDAREHG
jgi:hypothetical protein